MLGWHSLSSESRSARCGHACRVGIPSRCGTMTSYGAQSSAVRTCRQLSPCQLTRPPGFLRPYGVCFLSSGIPSGRYNSSPLSVGS